MLLIAFAQVGLWVNGGQAHLLHQPLDSFGIDSVSLLAQPYTHAPIAVKRRFQVLFIQ